MNANIIGAWENKIEIDCREREREKGSQLNIADLTGFYDKKEAYSMTDKIEENKCQYRPRLRK